MLTVVKKTTKRGGASAKLASTVMAVRPRRKRRARASRPVRGGSSFANTFASAYLATLNDPFEYPTPKLGYNNFTTSDTVVAYYRASIAVATDGTFAIGSFPGIGAGFALTNNSGNTTLTWQSQAASNSAAIAGNSSAARVVSGGVRVFCQTAETNKKGVLYAGSIPITTRSNITSLMTVNSMAQMPQFELGAGQDGAIALMRPQDNDSFVFWKNHVVASGWPTTAQSQMTVPMIIGSGWANDTTVWFEVIQNLEYLPQDYLPGIGMPVNNTDSTPNATTAFPSPEALFNRVKPYLSNAAVMDASEAAITALHPQLGSAVSAARSLFGRGRALAEARNHHARVYGVHNGIGQAYQDMAGRERVVIEEMKERDL